MASIVGIDNEEIRLDNNNINYIIDLKPFEIINIRK